MADIHCQLDWVKKHGRHCPVGGVHEGCFQRWLTEGRQHAMNVGGTIPRARWKHKQKKKKGSWVATSSSLRFLFWWKVKSSFPAMQTEADSTPVLWFHPSLLCWFTTTHNHSARARGTLFWSPVAPSTHMAPRHVCSQNTHTESKMNKSNKKFKK